MALRRIGIVGYDRIMALDLAGPADAFAAAGGHYEVIVLSVDGKGFAAESGLRFQPACSLRDAPALDTLIVPGGAGVRIGPFGEPIAAWVRRRARSIRRIASVCTGVYSLARTGLLDGRRVTTHWRFAADLAQRFPKLRVEPDAIFLRDGKFYTSAGVTAGVDLALALIEEDLGARAALAVARELVVYVKRLGGQEQFSEPLKFQFEAADRLGDLAGWMIENLDGDLSVEALAGRACLCPRHFTRRFKAAFGATPAAFVERLRLDEARHRLAAPRSSVAQVAASVGFGSADAFRRAFARRFRLSPAAYRSRFPS
jgi:transcriptional regulator GlxA family with amidase domain